MNGAIADQQTMFTELFNTLLDLANEGFGGKAVLAFYTDDALVACQGKVVPRVEIDEDEFGVTFAAVDAIESENRTSDHIRRPHISGAEALTIAADDRDHIVVWFRCNETNTEQPLCVATGWKCQAGRWLISWMTVQPTQASWSFAQGRMMAAADAAYIEGARFLTPRTWLDLGWYRVHGHRKPTLDILPGARFACHNSSACCRIGFNVKVPAHAQHVIDAIPWERHAPHLAGTRLPAADDKQLLLKNSDETCRFLDEKGHCRIHAACGRAVFHVCATYPIFFIDTPDGVDVTGSQTCSSFRGGLGPLLEERHEDLYARLALTPRDTSEQTYFIDNENKTTSWEHFRHLEKSLVNILLQEELPLAERLWQGCLLFDQEEDHTGGKYPDRPYAPQADDLPEWLATLDIWRAGFTEDDAVEPTETRPLFPQETRFLTEILLHLLIGKTVSRPHGLRMAHHLNVLVFHGASEAIFQMTRPGEPLPPEGWWQINSHLQHKNLLSHILETPSIKEWARRKDLMAYLLSPR
ncbi:MAG: hypothetical protein VKN33_00100 [Candidatus Sericytochromatia bacterium]|nr:hypothetical protein [Candidatus Sericytochromatia bacterium]